MPYQKHTSPYIEIRLYDDGEINLTTTLKGGELLANFIISHTNEGTKWKFTHRYILSSLMEGIDIVTKNKILTMLMDSDNISLGNLLSELYWQGQIDLT